ncbi:glutamate receptor ionotropic, delta-2-like isoform X1 [Rhynchophorus ferrugineus]|uniref:glutamate receptor ionotropic, delta-2-like isoform X1 n=1 Tax=Rhynchophorus ferrugineus TaxID=354439 RepID=UPI003FCD8005
MRMLVVFCWLCAMLVSGQENWSWRKNSSRAYKNQTSGMNCAFKLTNEMVQMVIEYSKWRNMAHVIVVDENIHSGCFMSVLKSHYRCFYVNRLMVSFRRKIRVFDTFLARQAVVVTFVKTDFNQSVYLDQANEIASNLDYFKWFNVVMPGTNVHSVFDTLAVSTLSVDADVVVALKMGNDLDQVWLTRAMVSMHKERTARRRSDAAAFQAPQSQRHQQLRGRVLRNGGVQRRLLLLRANLQDPEAVQRLAGAEVSGSVDLQQDSGPVCLKRFSTGSWDRDTGANALRPFQIIEKRDNFHRFPLILGKKTFTQETTVADENLIEDDNDEQNMDKFSDFITTYLNAREKTMVYPTLGLKAPDGKWNGLLGGVVEQKVDLGLDMVIKVPERYNDMSFSFDIMQSIRNIYVKPEESHTARDIFLIPFGTKMLLLVLLTGVICFVAMSLNLLLVGGDGSEPRSYLAAFSESSFWVLGVFCMQGSMIETRSVSGKMVIVMALLFTLLIYNSYSAFITSILSVKLKKIRTVGDLLDSNYVIAYSRNSQDEIYLRSMNNVSQLNQIYLRGYLHSDVTNITAGLLRATQGNYGFFATGHVARKEFLSISNYRCKFDLMELPVKQTRNNVAFPLSLHSPYKKLVNMCLIKMLESGVHDYITTLVAPSLPICSQQKTFRSARINDLFTCFILLGTGILTAFAVVMLEHVWKRRGRALKRRRRGPFPFTH